MASITSAAAGDWSATSTWTGGVVPGASDDVILAHVVVLDGNATVKSLTNSGAGRLSVNGSTNRALTVDTLALATTASASLVSTETTYTGTLTVAVTNPVAVGSHTGNGAEGVIDMRGGSLVASAPSWRGDDATTGAAPAPIRLRDSAVAADVTGNVSGGGYTYGIYCTATATITVTGNVTGGGSSNAWGIYCATTATITITGNVSGGGSYAYGIYCATTATITVTGNVTGGGGGSAYGIYATASGVTVIAQGNLDSGSTPGVVAIYAPGRAVKIGKAGATSTLTGYEFPINGLWVVEPGATIEIIRPGGENWPLLTGTPVSVYTLQESSIPAQVAAIVGAQIAAAKL